MGLHKATASTPDVYKYTSITENELKAKPLVLLTQKIRFEPYSKKKGSFNGTADSCMSLIIGLLLGLLKVIIINCTFLSIHKVVTCRNV